MDNVTAELDAASPETRSVHEDWHRRNMEEIRAAVTRGAGGIEASYFADQGLQSSFSSASYGGNDD
jgi:hypothetical protein